MDFLDFFLSRFSEHRQQNISEIPSFTQIYTYRGELLAERFNSVESSLNATAHSELHAIEDGLKFQKSKYLTDAVLITALEPCLQCTGSIIRVKIPKVIYFLPAKRGEGISSQSTESIYLLNHFPILTLINNFEIKMAFSKFFKEKR